MSKRKPAPPPVFSPLEEVLTIVLARTPRLDDAACIGSSDLFDPPSDGEARETTEQRHRDAVRLCWECPAIGACRDWALDEPRSGAVLAGRMPDARRPPGRPRSDSAA
ncbi:WhiB family transcriptional regulator [Rhodococcus sp. I2R]|uniref:WhiB family transcriptional regulator n=1 Tax=Rhodococcus sp. I2R TaxID=2855445 RepID=UPI001E2F3E9A|nr:WhiB family transcriptional regulator [Rhodococcus sp. I2R]MCC8929750.1 WhiB family transcriptional regulator [Rhodococcus sp. I2R]